MDFKTILPTQVARPILITGPCSAESYQQLDELVERSLKLYPIDLLRAGIWKPRTRPDSFHGVGLIGLEWLKLIKQKYNIRVSTEVANANHVEHALKAGIDVLWVGARTTVNPFYVQEIAEAMKGVDVPVYVKNPMNPDLDLWIGALERFFKLGIHRIGAIHRGFSFYGNAVYRNVPHWEIPIELKRRFPQIQLICDISHISGSTLHLKEIAQIAMDLQYEGIMAEVHPNPQSAWSDKEQQITPENFKTEILDQLVIRKSSGDLNQIKDIEELRVSIDNIDDEILRLIAERMKIAEQIGELKKNHDITIYQPERWQKVLERMKSTGKKLELNEEFISSLIQAIHVESIQHQSKKMNS